jgi:hypothetical protein
MWNPPIALTPEEQKIAARTQKTRKFFVFLPTLSNPSREKFDKDDRPLPQTSEGG